MAALDANDQNQNYVTCQDEPHPQFFYIQPDNTFTVQSLMPQPDRQPVYVLNVSDLNDFRFARPETTAQTFCPLATPLSNTTNQSEPANKPMKAAQLEKVDFKSNKVRV
jgi:hypothetical protein